MGDDYENLWIVNEEGQIIYDFIRNEKFNPEMMGQMLIAFNALIKKLGEENLSCIDWDERIIHILKKNEILFAICTDPDLKLSKVEKTLDHISERFFAIYSKVLIDDFDGDRNIFSHSEERFTKVVEQTLD
ncbi:MAG: hypothetical protein ACOC35_01575 [Promethearchaeia archaeon]